MKIKFKILFFIGLMVIITSLIFSLTRYHSQKKALLNGIDQKLLTAAYAAKNILPDDYHDKIINKNSVSPDEYLKIVEKYNQLCLKTDIQYIWSLIIINDQMVFTSGTSTSKDIHKGDHALFFDTHTNPDAYKEAFTNRKVQYSSFHDKWGEGRMVLVPHHDINGRPYLFAASMSLSAISNILKETMLNALLISVPIFLIGIFFTFLFANSLSRPIIQIIQTAHSIGRGDFSARANDSSKDELGVLAIAINKMVSDLQDITASRDELNREIAERKQIEEQFRHSQELMHYVISHARTAIAVHDRNLNYIYVSDRYLKEYNVKDKNVIGKHHYEVFPDLPQKWRDVHQRALAGEISSAEEDPYFREDGSVEWTRWECRPWYEKDGVIGGLIVYTEVITERKRREEQLKQSEQFIRSILDSVDEGFIVIDSNYRIISANKAYCKQVNLTSDNVIGKHCYNISHKSNVPCYENGEKCAAKHVFETGEPCTCTHKHEDSNYDIINVETKAFPIKDKTGQVISVIEVVNNISERYLLEEERLKSHKLESIGTLAGGIAHDFNNLLQGIFGFISMAKLTFDDRELYLSHLEQAEKALHQSVNLTNQLLTFSKGGKPVKKSMLIHEIIENSVKFALSGSRSEYSLKLDPDLWPTNVDEGQLGQVIQNIVLNADQAMPDGGKIEIEARNISPSNDKNLISLVKNNHILLSIKDTGSGIPKSILAKIFDPYFTTKQKGSGLGLATSYSVIRNHGGFINVKSKIGKGTLFQIYLPAEKLATLPKVPETKKSLHAISGKILMMDDEKLVRNLAEKQLKLLGHTPFFAWDGKSAIEEYIKAKESGDPFDAVILDLTIRGGKGGDETMKELLEIDPDIKAIVSSGYSDDDSMANYYEKGFKGYLKKPYSLMELKNAINSLLDS